MPPRQPPNVPQHGHHSRSLVVAADKLKPRYQHLHQQQHQQQRQKQEKHDRFNYTSTTLKRSVGRSDRSNSRSRSSSPHDRNVTNRASPQIRQMQQHNPSRDRRDRSRGHVHSNSRRSSRSHSQSRSRSPWYRSRPRGRSFNNSDGEKKQLQEKKAMEMKRRSRSGARGSGDSRGKDSRERRYPSDSSHVSCRDGNNRNRPLSRNSTSSSGRRRSSSDAKSNKNVSSHGNKKFVTTGTMTLKKILRRRNNTKKNKDDGSPNRVLKKYLQVEDADISKSQNDGSRTRRRDFYAGYRNHRHHHHYPHSDLKSRDYRRPGPSPSTWSSSASASRSFEDPLSTSRSSRSRSRSTGRRSSGSRSNSYRGDWKGSDDYDYRHDDHADCHTRKYRPRLSSSATETSTTFLKTDSSFRSYPTSETSSRSGNFRGSSSGSKISGASSVDDHIHNANVRECEPELHQYPSIYVVNDSNHGASVSTLYDSIVDSLAGEIHCDCSYGEDTGNAGNSTDSDQEEEAKAATDFGMSPDISMRELREIIYAFESDNVGIKKEDEHSDAIGSCTNTEKTRNDGIVNMFADQINIIDNLDSQIHSLMDAFEREDGMRKKLAGEYAPEEKDAVSVHEQVVVDPQEREEVFIHEDDEEDNEEGITDIVPHEVKCNRDQSHDVSTMSSCNGMEGSTSFLQSITIDQLEKEERSSHLADDNSSSDSDDDENMSMNESAIFGSPIIEEHSSSEQSGSDFGDDGDSAISSTSSSIRFHDALRHASSTSGRGRDRYLDESPDDLTRIHRNNRRSRSKSAVGKHKKFRLWKGKNKRKNKPRVAKWSKIGVDSVCRMEWTDHEGRVGSYSGSVNHDDVPHGEGAMRMFHNGEIRKGLWINGVLNVGKCDEVYQRMAERLTED
mmetsp:Transcript_3149/g.6320  ORF Transcript_3149/g.6320 Transcript_3149/m.6320 type:complete len:896 (-) Transcript_3149:413-3100(-)